MIQLAICEDGYRNDPSDKKKLIDRKLQKVSEKIVTVSDGVVYSHQYYPKTQWSVHTLTADLSNPQIQLMVAKGLNHVAGLERVQDMAHRIDSAYVPIQVLAGINSNFWKAGSNFAIGPLIVNGIFVNNVKYKNWSSFVFTMNQQLLIDRFNFDIDVHTHDTTIIVHSFNRRFDSTSIALYNHFFGPVVPFIDTLGVRQLSQDTIRDETDLDSITVAVLDSLWTINPEKGTRKIQFVYSEHSASKSNIICKVTSIDTSAMSVPINGGVLSLGHNQNIFNNITAPGDSFIISIKCNPFVHSQILQMITGTPRLVRNGKISVEWQEEGLHKRRFIIGRYGRSAIGISKNGKKIILMTVESSNRKKRIRGIGLNDLARLLILKDAYNAMNVDGGSSATMLVDKNTIVPESGVNHSRKVSSAIFIVKNPAVVSEKDK